MPKGMKVYKLIPEFRPLHIQVLLDEGVKEMRGAVYNLMIMNVRYDASRLIITVKR